MQVECTDTLKKSETVLFERGKIYEYRQLPDGTIEAYAETRQYIPISDSGLYRMKDYFVRSGPAFDIGEYSFREMKQLLWELQTLLDHRDEGDGVHVTKQRSIKKENGEYAKEIMDEFYRGDVLVKELVASHFDEHTKHSVTDEPYGVLAIQCERFPDASSSDTLKVSFSWDGLQR